ncbi:MAG: GFA family protein [Methyloceanibacter sp.]
MTTEGGCFCGAVRYAADGYPLRVMHCHCTICRRTSGAPVVTWITFPVAGFRWTKGTPTGLKSTANATRNFCSKCGSHMAFTIDGAKELDITVGTLDNPLAAAPGYHIFNDTRLAWFKLEDGLPTYDDWGPNV